MAGETRFLLAPLPLLVLLLLLGLSEVSAVPLYVYAASQNPTPPYSTWATAATRIQDAVDAAPAGTLILVSNGVYAGGVTVTKPLSLMSVNGAKFTIIDGGGTNRCLYETNGLWVQGFSFTNGYADVGAGVLGADTNCILTNCVFKSNSAGTGGGVYGATLYNCLLTGNIARGNGSGGGAAYSVLYNCTVSGNFAAQAGGVFESTLDNCIVYDNTTASEPNYSSSSLNYCCTTPLPASGVGNITNAPQFVNEALGDFRLQAGSPCINAGNNAYAGAVVDLAGNPRIAGASVDMGAYEYTGSGGALGSYVMSFQFSDFPPSNGNPAPTDPVIGTISWQAASIHDPIQGFDSISLTLDGHTYDANELRYLQNPGSSFSEIYAGPFGPGVASLTDGFYLSWDNASLLPSAFGYTSSRISGIWMIDPVHNPASFTSFSIISRAEPVISTQPLSQTVIAGTNVTLSVGASGSLPLFWQWSVNGKPIQDATNSSLDIPSVSLGQAGTYSVIVSNLFGVTTSSNATLTVLLPGTKYVWQNSPNPTTPYTNWATAAHGVQEVVDVSAPGDTILVTNGVYASGSRTVDVVQNRLVIPDTVTLQSVNGPQVTIIDGGGTNRCVLMTTNALLSGFTLTNGSAMWNGGGVAGGLLTNCVLTGNQAGYGGGADSCTLFNCILTNNSLYAGYTNGCAVSGSTLYNCILTRNSGPGSAVADWCHLYNCLVSSNSASGANVSTLYNCTLTGNLLGAEYCSLYNCISYYNYAYDNFGLNFISSTLNYCCTTPMPNGGVGNITNAPLFVDQAGGDLHLQPSSPCINAGNNTYVAGATDLDGNPRIIDGTVDIGAYEYIGQVLSAFHAWLQSYGLPADGSADYADTDGDGMNNFLEFACGTNPTNSSSALRLLSAVPVGTNVLVTWQSVAGINYSLERCANLTSAQALPNFIPVATNISGQQGTTSFVDTNAAASGSLYYRVAVLPPL